MALALTINIVGIEQPRMVSPRHRKAFVSRRPATLESLWLLIRRRASSKRRQSLQGVVGRTAIDHESFELPSAGPSPRWIALLNRGSLQQGIRSSAERLVAHRGAVLRAKPRMLERTEQAESKMGWSPPLLIICFPRWDSTGLSAAVLDSLRPPDVHGLERAGSYRRAERAEHRAVLSNQALRIRMPLSRWQPAGIQPSLGSSRIDQGFRAAAPP